MVLKLYRSPNSTRSQRIAAVLLEKQVPFELIAIKFAAAEHKSPAFLEKHPFGQVPYTISSGDNGFILCESHAICRSIATTYANQGTKLIHSSSRTTELHPTFEVLIKKLDGKLDAYDKILNKQMYFATAATRKQHRPAPMNDTVLVKNQLLLEKLQFEASLTNENVLSDVERSRGLEILKRTKTTLWSLDQRLKLLPRTDTHLPTWISVRDESKNRIHLMQLALAPHKLLPAEILSDIFLLCQGEDSCVRFPANFAKPPWVILMVCRHWNNLVCANPRLWRHVRVDVGYGRSAVEAAARVIFSRGTTSITLRCRDLSTDIIGFNMLVAPHLPRLQSLDLSIPHHIFLRLLEVPPENFASVASLNLTVFADSTPFEAVLDALGDGFLRKAQRLRKLELSTQTMIPMRLGVAWKQIIGLELVLDSSASTLHQILEECSCLENLTMIFQGDIWPAGDLKLPRLTSLKATIRNGQILRHLLVPALLKLCIAGSIRLPNSDLTTMIQRSGCNILDLVYDGPSLTYDTEELHAFFELLPYLKSLSTFSMIINLQTLKGIAHRDILPNLEAVQIRIDSPEVFVDMIGAKLTFKHATGYYSQALNLRLGTIDAATEWLERINKVRGTSYALMND
ncbi:hypothetical protein DXG01_004013 [Tephrocybe rancida]|nr:hypothetical protein DXG01_004013 [Tephrocybe rancida]